MTIFAGGNDANAIGSAVRAGNGGADPRAYIDTQVRNFGRDLATLVNGIRERAPQARIVLLNLPNLAGLPYVSTYPVAERSVLQRIAVGFSAQANALAASNVLVIDLMCDDRSYHARQLLQRRLPSERRRLRVHHRAGLRRRHRAPARRRAPAARR